MKLSPSLLLALSLSLAGWVGLPACTSESTSTSNDLALTDKLVAYWDFNEGAGSLLTDYSGHHRHGRLVGFENRDWIQGPAATATTADRGLDLAYANRAVTFTKPTGKFGQFSLGAWLRPRALDTTTNPQLIIHSRAAAGPVLTMLDNGTVQFTLNGQAQPLLTAPTPLHANAWQHVAVTFDDASHQAQLYINGKAAGSTALKEALQVALDSSFTIGKREADQTANFDGSIDEVVLYERPLTGAEVAALASGQAPPRAKPAFSAAETAWQRQDPTAATPMPNRKLTAVAPGDFPANPVEKAGYRLTRQDEFNGPRLDETLWIPYYLRHRVSDEQAKADYVFRNGMLVLQIGNNKLAYNDKGLRISAIQTFERADLHKPGRRKDLPTVTRFVQQFGYFEVRAKTQVGAGNLASFWLAGVQQDSTQSGEIDVFEQPGHLGPNAMLWNLYDWHDARLRPRLTRIGYQNRLRHNKDLTATFNLYGLEWTPTELKFFFNNQLVHTIPKSPQYPMGVFLSMYVGNDWFGNLDPRQPYPREFVIDYFRAYQKQ